MTVFVRSDLERSAEDGNDDTFESDPQILSILAHAERGKKKENKHERTMHSDLKVYLPVMQNVINQID